MLEEKTDEFKTAQSEHIVDGTKILEDMGSAMDELKHKLGGEIAVLEQKIDELKVAQDADDDQSKNSGTNLRLASKRD